MLPPLPEGWVATTKSIGLARRVTILCRDDDRLARDVATRYQQGELSPLSPVKSHRWGGHVEHGPHGEDGATWFFKSFAVRNPRFLHKPRRARNTLRQETLMADAGFLAPRLRAVIEERIGGLLISGACISEGLQHMQSLHGLLNGDTAMAPAKRRQLLAEFGSEVGRWHRAGFFHGDMHINNVYVERVEGDLRFWWIDNEEGAQYGDLPRARRIHDLLHICRQRHALSRSDWMRMWKAYTAAAGLDEDAARPLATELEAGRSAYQARRARRGKRR